MKNLLLIGLSFLVVISSILVAHYFLLDVILFIPSFLVVSILLICFSEMISKSTLKLLYKGIILAALLGFHDIGMKLFLLREFSDKVNMLITLIVLGSCLYLGITIFVFTVLIDKKENFIQKIIALIVFIIFIIIHIYLFKNL